MEPHLYVIAEELVQLHAKNNQEISAFYNKMHRTWEDKKAKINERYRLLLRTERENYHKKVAMLETKLKKKYERKLRRYHRVKVDYKYIAQKIVEGLLND